MIAPTQFNVLAVLLALAVPLPALAGAPTPDGASLEYGSGSKVALLRAGLQSHWERRWFEHNGRHIGAYWDVQLARWQGRAYQNVKGQNQNITDFGLTPVFRWQADERKGWYLEGGIGVHWLSALVDNDANCLSTRFQFGDHAGAGYVLDNGWDLGLKVQHFSNGGIKKPNSGVNFVVVKVTRAF
ncbi:acyloxyacyl hydrolase [Massilia sp. TSP1-1-2]|uniref:acyloxyacyl hydrolase n=1 Tax=unclassified Massilia TaxID=2609279 RepID=UPI003CF03084